MVLARFGAPRRRGAAKIEHTVGAHFVLEPVAGSRAPPLGAQMLGFTTSFARFRLELLVSQWSEAGLGGKLCFHNCFGDV